MYQINSGDLRDQIGANKGEASIFQPYQTDYFTDQLKYGLAKKEAEKKKAEIQAKALADYDPKIKVASDVRHADMPFFEESGRKMFDFYKNNATALSRGDVAARAALAKMQTDHEMAAHVSKNQNEIEKNVALELFKNEGKYEPEAVENYSKMILTPQAVYDPSQFQKKFDKIEHEKAMGGILGTLKTSTTGSDTKLESGDIVGRKDVAANKRDIANVIQSSWEGLSPKAKASYGDFSNYNKSMQAYAPSETHTTDLKVKSDARGAGGYMNDQESISNRRNNIDTLSSMFAKTTQLIMDQNGKYRPALGSEKAGPVAPNTYEAYSKGITPDAKALMGALKSGKINGLAIQNVAPMWRYNVVTKDDEGKITTTPTDFDLTTPEGIAEFNKEVLIPAKKEGKTNDQVYSKLQKGLQVDARTGSEKGEMTLDSKFIDLNSPEGKRELNGILNTSQSEGYKVRDEDVFQNMEEKHVQAPAKTKGKLY
jgi:hypothetical protein